MKLYIPPVFQRVITSTKDILVFWGSRGGAKSESIARCIIALCLTRKGFRAFCARQTQDNKDTTLILIFQDIINQTQGLKDKCKIFKDKIEFNNGSIIFFVGLNERTMDKAKGIKADLYWFDEAHALDRITYRTLVPSVREKNSKVIISFNPRYEFDFVVTEFLNDPAPNVEVIQVDYRSNPFFSEKLERLREADKAKLPHAEYMWIWENGFQPMLENAIFDEDALKRFGGDYEFARSYFRRIVIGIDPATTSKDYNNESGIAVVGLTIEGEVLLIEDASGHLKPNDLAKRVSELYNRYACDGVVVEVNQGGDFIKSTILGYDSSLRVIEVRAKQDKIKRMLPIANEVYLGRVKGIRQQSEKVLEQFMKFTTNGYLGAKGESPDRAEAFAWACFELLGISEYGTKGGVFKPEMLVCDIGGIHRYNVAYFFSWGRETALFLAHRYTFGTNDIFNFVDCRRFENTNIEAIEDIDLSDYVVAVNDNPVVASVVKHLNPKGKIYTIKAPKEEVNQQSDKVVSLIQNRVNLRDCKPSVYNGVENNILQNDLLCYYSTQNENEVSVTVRGFCALILSEFRG